MNGFGLHVIPMVGLILLSWLGLRSLGMERGAPPAAPGWPSGCTFPEVELPGGQSSQAVFGAGKTRSLTFLLAWFALTTNLRFGVAHKENPAGRAITKLLSSFDLNEDQQTLFIRPVGKEEATANTASTKYDKAMFHSTGLIPGAKVVVTTTGLIWEQKGQMHSPLESIGKPGCSCQ